MGYVFDADEIGDYRTIRGEHSLALEAAAESFRIHAAFSETGADAGLYSLWNEFPHPELPYTMLDALIVGLLRIALTREGVYGPDGLTLDEVRDKAMDYLEALLPREIEEEGN